MTDDAGNVTAEIDGIYLRRVERRTVPLPLSQKIFDTTWVESPIAAEATPQDPRVRRAEAGSCSPTQPDEQARVTADEFVARWRSPTRRVNTADLADEPAVLAAFAETAGDPEHPPVGLVVFVGGRLGRTDDGLARARESVWSISTVVRAIVGGWHGRSPRLWLVTGGGLSVHDDEPGAPATAALKGLVRVLAYEHPDLRTTLVDLDVTQDPDRRAECGTGQSLGSGIDDVIAWRGGRRYVERLSPGDARRTPYSATGRSPGSVVHRHRWPRRSRPGRRPMAGGQRRRPGRPQRPQRTLRRTAQGPGRTGSRAEIVVVRGDVASPGVAESLIEAAARWRRELRGIVHAAAVIEDSLLFSMSRESLERVWAPKAAGALRMHQASANCELDWWLGFSSVASLLGSPGQTAYACASAWLDALVTWRRASGLPAAVINWGPWSEVGVAQSLVGSALDPITPAEGMEALESLLATDRSRTGVTRLRPDRALVAFPEIRSIGYFTQVVEELDAAGDGGDWAGPDALRDLDPAEARAVVTERLCARIAAVMGYADRSAVDPTVPLTELGMDSLMAVRIRNTARADFGVEPPVTLLLAGRVAARPRRSI